jgi:translation initiation factor 1 (eIF-1/SUI1)
MYRVYSAPAGAASISPMEKEHLLYKEVGSMDEAISWASHMSRTGHSVVSIEGDDGTQLGASEIASALRRHTA